MTSNPITRQSSVLIQLFLERV